MDEADREQHDQFLRLFMKNEEALRLFVRSLLFNHEEVREVMQEVAIVLWRKFDDSLDSESFRRWAFGVARMEVLSFRRDRARDRLCFSDNVAELLERTLDEEFSATTAPELIALEVCMKKLPENQKELAQSAYESGVKMNDLAETVGLTAMALYKKLHRIRLQLMKCMQRELASNGTHE